MPDRPSTDVDAANIALAYCNQRKIASFADPTKRAREAKLHYGLVRDALLRKGWWNFAKTWVNPAADATDSLGPLKKRYLLPQEIIAVRYIEELERREDWEVENATAVIGGAQVEAIAVVTNYVGPTICCTKRVDNVRIWDAAFCEAFCIEYAIAMSGKLGGLSATRRAELQARAKELTPEARRLDAREKKRQTISRDVSWARVRRGW